MSSSSSGGGGSSTAVAPAAAKAAALAARRSGNRAPVARKALETDDTLLRWQLQTKVIVTSMRWEMLMLFVVIIYFVVVFLTFAIADLKIARMICNWSHQKPWIDEQCKSVTLNPLDRFFYWADFAFMTLFLVEIALKLFAIGHSYLKDVFNGVDFLIIVVSMVMTMLALFTSALENTGGAENLLPIFKIVRLLRVVVVMTRLQRTRERLRRNKMVGLAAPVEKVFEIITALRQKPTLHPEDDKALAWTMDLIAKEELYKVNFTDSKSSSGMHLTAEMTDWLRSNLQASLPGSLLSKDKGGGGGGGGGGREGSDKGSQRSGAGTAKGGKAAEEAEKRKASQSRFALATIPTWITKSIAEPTVASVLAKMEKWDFDVFALHEVTNGHPLVVGGIHLMTSMGVLDKIPIPKDKLATYLLNIERGYVPTNPFHNAVHAADVMFTTHFFLNAPLLRDMTGPLDKFAAVLAAALHDYAHPGLSNPFLIATRDETATLYNDQSVLEMFHIAGSFRVMLTTPGCDVNEGMSREQFRQFRETMISMVLATDLKVHFEHLGRLKTRVATDAYASVERKDVLLLLGQALHAADISNPAKIRPTMLRWTERVMKEFWMQGDREASLGLPISAFMDRRQPQVQTCQIGFINVLVKPLYVEWHKLLGETVQEAIDCLEGSLKIWETEGNAPAQNWDTEEFVR